MVDVGRDLVAERRALSADDDTVQIRQRYRPGHDVSVGRIDGWHSAGIVQARIEVRQLVMGIGGLAEIRPAYPEIDREVRAHLEFVLRPSLVLPCPEIGRDVHGKLREGGDVPQQEVSERLLKGIGAARPPVLVKLKVPWLSAAFSVLL